MVYSIHLGEDYPQAPRSNIPDSYIQLMPELTSCIQWCANELQNDEAAGV